MKKELIVTGIVIYVLGSISPSFAMLRKDRDYYTGEIVSVEKSSNMITIRDLNSRIERTFKVEKRLKQTLTAGTDVMVNVQKGTNVAKGVRLVEPRKKMVNPNKLDYFIGQIVSLDRDQKKITILDYNSRIERTFILEKDLRQELLVDCEVVVHAEKGTQNAKSARIVTVEPVE